MRPRGKRLRPATLLDVSVGLGCVANRAYSVAVVVYVFDATHSASAVAVAAAVRYGAGLVAPAATLRAIARWRPRRLLVLANLSAGLTLGACAGAMATNLDVGIVIALASLGRAATTVLPPATAALPPSVLDGRDVVAVATRHNAVDKLALLSGPAIGGLLLIFVTPTDELLFVAAILH